MADQPIQADREAVLVWAESYAKDTERSERQLVARVLLAVHAENERLRKSIRNIPFALGGRIPAELSDRLVAGILESDDTKTQEPKMTETQAETTQLTGDALASLYYSGTCKARGIDDGHRFHTGLRNVYDAGRASLAGELATWKHDADVLGRKWQDMKDELEAEKAAHQKAERERRESNGWLSFLAERCGIEHLRTVTTEDLVRGVCDALAARQARVMPSREAIADAIHDATYGEDKRAGAGWFEPYLRAADRVLRLLAPTHDSPGASPEGETCPSSERSPSSSKPNSAPSQPSSPLSRETCERTPGTGSSPASKASDTPVSRTSSPPRTNPSRSSSASGTGAQPTDASSDPPVPEKDIEEACQYIRACVATGDSLERACRNAAEVFATDALAQQARYVPSVGERAVLVASPDEEDAGLVGVAVLIVDVASNSHERLHWHVKRESGAKRYIHRDATWRRVEERPFCREAPPDSEIGQVHELEANPIYPAEDCPTPLRYVGKRVWNGQHKGHSWNRRFGDSVLGWRRAEPQGNARPVEPAAGVATPPRRFASPAEALSCLRETIAEECHQEHPAHEAVEAVEALETIEALSRRVEALSKRFGDLETRQNGLSVQQAEAERDLDRRVDAGSRRLDELEIKARVMGRWVAGEWSTKNTIDVLARIEREERAKAHTSANPPTKT